uniref:Sulfotransfer_1 domain-containing protein n=1 Tax=Macrostomum lignano TaxID=282301 RepID=A0A1I8FMG9_9PLAT
AYMLENGDSGPHANSPVRNLTRVMDTWTHTGELPAGPVRIRGNKLHFRQERFLLVPNATSIWKSNQTSRFGFRWIVPIRYVTDQISEPRWVWMDLEEEKTIELDHEPKFVRSTSTRLGCTGAAAMSSPTGRELIRLSREIAVMVDEPLVTNKLFKMYQQWRANTSFPRSGLRELVWSYFERNWDIMMERYDMAFTLTEVTKFPAEFHTEYDYQRLSSFFANRDLQSGWRSAYQSLESKRKPGISYGELLD